MDDDPDYFGIRAAGRRVGRSRMTIHRWVKSGMPVQIINGRKQISRDDLLSAYRQKLINARDNRRRLREKVERADLAKKLSTES